MARDVETGARVGYVNRPTVRGDSLWPSNELWGVKKAQPKDAREINC